MATTFTRLWCESTNIRDWHTTRQQYAGETVGYRYTPADTSFKYQIAYEISVPTPDHLLQLSFDGPVKAHHQHILLPLTGWTKNPLRTMDFATATYSDGEQNNQMVSIRQGGPLDRSFGYSDGIWIRHETSPEKYPPEIFIPVSLYTSLFKRAISLGMSFSPFLQQMPATKPIPLRQTLWQPRTANW